MRGTGGGDFFQCLYQDTLPGSETVISSVPFHQDKPLACSKKKNLRPRVERRLGLFMLTGYRLTRFFVCSVCEGRVYHVFHRLGVRARLS